jgi:hypothetical protein
MVGQDHSPALDQQHRLDNRIQRFFQERRQAGLAVLCRGIVFGCLRHALAGDERGGDPADQGDDRGRGAGGQEYHGGGHHDHDDGP